MLDPVLSVRDAPMWGEKKAQIPTFMKLASWWEREKMCKINRPLNGAVR